MATYSTEFGYVYEGEGSAGSSLSVSFEYATSVDEICAVAYGIDEDGNATRTSTAISSGLITYNSSSKAFTCQCPFDNCASWKIFIWLKNTDLSDDDLEWSSGDTIPVAAIVDDVNLLMVRVKEHATNIARAIKVPETGTNDLFVPPIEARADKILGFDKYGNPACGEDVAEIADFREEMEEIRDDVKNSEANAEKSASAASTSASEAASYANDAKSSATSASTSASSASSYATQAQSSANTAKTYSQQAETSATKAASSASDAKGYAADAKEYASEAKTSENNAASSATASANSATASANSAAASANSATSSANSASASAESASASAESATESAESASESATSASESAKSAEEAAESASEAAASASKAAASASEAESYATDAANSAKSASASAEASEASAEKSQSSAADAASSASSAAASATYAESNATNAAASAGAAAASATASANSAIDAATNADSAAQSAMTAATNATSAAMSASAAAASATASENSSEDSKGSADKSQECYDKIQAILDDAIAEVENVLDDAMAETVATELEKVKTEINNYFTELTETNIATSTKYGVVKLYSDDIIYDGIGIGVNSSGQLYADTGSVIKVIYDDIYAIKKTAENALDAAENIDLSGYVTIDTEQTITGEKTFTANTSVSKYMYVGSGSTDETFGLWIGSNSSPSATCYYKQGALQQGGLTYFSIGEHAGEDVTGITAYIGNEADNGYSLLSVGHRAKYNETERYNEQKDVWAEENKTRFALGYCADVKTIECSIGYESTSAIKYEIGNWSTGDISFNIGNFFSIQRNAASKTVSIVFNGKTLYSDTLDDTFFDEYQSAIDKDREDYNASLISTVALSPATKSKDSGKESEVYEAVEAVQTGSFYSEQEERIKALEAMVKKLSEQVANLEK